MQGTRVRALVWEDPTCRGETRLREPQLLRLRVWSLRVWSLRVWSLRVWSLRVWSLRSAAGEAAIVRGPRLPQLEKALAQKRRPNTAINKLIN